MRPPATAGPAGSEAAMARGARPVAQPTRDDPFGGRSRASGFTLAELLVVIAIMAALMAIIVPSSLTLARQNRRHTCAAHLKQLGQALALFHEDYGCYPPDETEYLWTPEAVQEYQRLYGESPPSDFRDGTPTGAAYHPDGRPFAPQPDFLYYDDPARAVHGLGLYTLYYLGAYAAVLPPLAVEPRITAGMRDGSVKVGDFTPRKGYNQPYFSWFRGSGYVTGLSTFHCPENDTPLEQKALTDRPRLPGLTRQVTYTDDQGQSQTRTEYWNNYDQFYRRNFWDPGHQPDSLEGLTEEQRLDRSRQDGATRNLLQPYPPMDTVVTWCPYHHKGYVPRWPGDDRVGGSQDRTLLDKYGIRPGDMDLVLLVDGSVRRMVARQDAAPYKGSTGGSGWPYEPAM